VTYGESDEWGYKPLDRDNPTQVYDIHATILHLLGIDHKRLTVRHNGIDRRLTDVHGHVIPDIVS
jgi:arylsulfatase A-like enzyme